MTYRINKTNEKKEALLLFVFLGSMVVSSLKDFNHIIITDFMFALQLRDFKAEVCGSLEGWFV